MEIQTDPRVKTVFDQYPPTVQSKMLALRQLILDTAQSMPEVITIEETLKWGEPSYLTKSGSTLRMDWKAKNPDRYSLFFKCTSQLVPTFRALFADQLRFEGNREVWFELEENIPVEVLKHCISMTLRYHKVKHLPLLGYQ